MKSYDVTALGELLIDFTENGSSSQGNPLMEANPGGAPCYVLALLSRLGHKTAFIGKVGQGQFGDRLQEALTEVGIDTKGLQRDAAVHTTLAFMGKERVFMPAYPNPKTIETTGAGDTFCGSVLHYALEHGWRSYTAAELREMLAFANAAASIITTRKGALRVMPTFAWRNPK